jgi:hypothetical protein
LYGVESAFKHGARLETPRTALIALLFEFPANPNPSLAPLPQGVERLSGTRCGTLLALVKGDREVSMKGTKLLGAMLLAVGILALAYGGFSYTKNTDKVNIGPIHFEVKDKETVNIPLWAGVAVAIVGGVLLARKD